MTHFHFILLLVVPFLLALLLPTASRLLGAKTGWLALFGPLASFQAVATLHGLEPGERTALTLDWIPSLGIAVSLTPDGLALFFGTIVSGMGILVVLYATQYLDSHARDHGRFYCYLLLFMGAMQLTVFSSNLLVLFVAWELTSLTSFLLIGFQHEEDASRRGARMALLSTGGGGLALLAGIVLLRGVFGSFDLSAMIDTPVPPGKEGQLLAAFLCCLTGIATKSAQFPFHFWLPNAMSAPTPVSAYLHSATMVKLGIFLTARLLPVFNGLEAWTPILTGLGFGTMVVGAGLALFSHDLKGILAYTTVSQLGLLIGQYGLFARGYPVAWDYLHVVNHALYKAGFFMVVGIIDHATGTRDIRALGGVLRLMPLTGVVGVLGAAALAGLPPTTGFLSKELVLKSLFEFGERTAGFPGLWPLLAFVSASVIKVAIAARFVHRLLLGHAPENLHRHFHAPGVLLQLPALLLMLSVLAGGLMASEFGRWTLSYGVLGTHALEAETLHLWHGFTPELITSAGVIMAGLLVYGFCSGRLDQMTLPAWLRFDHFFDHVVEAVPKAASRLNRCLGFESPSVYLSATVLGMLATVAGALLLLPVDWRGLAAQWEPWPQASVGWVRWGVTIAVGFAAIAAALWQHPLRQIFALSVIGMGVTLYFVLYRAPDLALTQILVETITLLLVLLVVLRLRRDGADEEAMARLPVLHRLVKLALSLGFGLLLGGGVLLFQQPRTDAWAGMFYIENSVALAKGTNAVNTVVIDFRGWDTLLEITVLVIASLGVLGLLARRRSASNSPSLPPQADLFPVPADRILKAVALGAFLPLNTLALFLFFRGHNLPGGGFVAGLVTALSLLLLVFVLGVHELRRRMRFNPITLALAGVSLALVVALLPVANGLPLLAHQHAYAGSFYLGTALWFDLGVYLTVVGVSLKLLLPLMKSVHRLPAFVREEEGAFMSAKDEPIDVVQTEPAGIKQEDKS